MKHKKFYNPEHAVDYLSGSMVRVDDYPVWCISVRSDMTMVYRDATGGDMKAVHLEDARVDLNPMPLGFLAINEDSSNNGLPTTIFMARVPYRQWKIGLTARTCAVFNPFRPANKWYVDIDTALCSKEIVNTVRGNYVDFEKAHWMTKHTESVCAPFSRRFAVHDDYLLYKALGEPVGSVAGGLPTLDEDFLYLAEALQEDLDVKH